MRRIVDKCKAAEIDRDSNARRISLLQSELAARSKAEAALSDELAAAETKLRSTMRALSLAEENLAQERARVHALEETEKLKSASLEVEVDAKTTSLQELSQRLVAAESQIKSKESAVASERAKADALHTQVSQLVAAEAAQQRELETVRQELQGVKEHAKATEEMLERKNKNIATLEAEVQSVEAELAKVESQLALFRRQAADRNVEAASQRERAEAASQLSVQLREKLDEAGRDMTATREAHAKEKQNADETIASCKRREKEAAAKTRELEQERELLRGRMAECEMQLRAEQTRADALASKVERFAEMEEELAAANEANRAAEKRIKQLRESSGELGEKVEQLVALEKERRERKLVISCVLLGATDDNAREQVQRSAKALGDSLHEWGTFANEDASCLTKIGNAYQLALQSSIHSYYHCIRVLAQLCALARVLRQSPHELVINDPARTGVVCTSDRSPGHGAVDEFVAKIEHATEKAFVAVGEAVFRRVHPYLAPAILNHMPAQDEHRIEETVVDSGNERGKFMSHTVLSTLTDARDWMVRYGLPEAVMKQLFVTLTYNLNSYLFQYLIQTPSICKPSNAFVIKTRLGLLSDWYSQERNAAFQEVGLVSVKR